MISLYCQGTRKTKFVTAVANCNPRSRAFSILPIVERLGRFQAHSSPHSVHLSVRLCICYDRSARGWGIIKDNFHFFKQVYFSSFIFKFPDCFHYNAHENGVDKLVHPPLFKQTRALVSPQHCKNLLASK